MFSKTVLIVSATPKKRKFGTELSINSPSSATKKKKKKSKRKEIVVQKHVEKKEEEDEEEKWIDLDAPITDPNQ